MKKNDEFVELRLSNKLYISIDDVWFLTSPYLGQNVTKGETFLSRDEDAHLVRKNNSPKILISKFYTQCAQRF